MDDLISRAEALKALKDMSVTYDAETVQRCIEAVSNLPSAQPEDKCGECDAWNQYKNYPRPTVDAAPVIRCKAFDSSSSPWQTYFETTEKKTAIKQAVPVIRCKDCKHWGGYFCHNKWWGDGYGNYTPPIKDEDGFCDWAERKEE